MARLVLARIQPLERADSGRGPERAAQFLAMTREAAIATGDPSFQAAWANLDKVKSVIGSAMPHDEAAQDRLVTKAREQIADHLRAGHAIVEVSKEQAWRNAPMEKAPSPPKDRER